MRPLHCHVRAAVLHFFCFGVCANALPAADLDVLEVRPSLSVCEAAVAARGDVCLGGALRCDRALPAAVFEVAPVDLFVSVFEAARAAGFEVTFVFFAMKISSCSNA